MFGRFSQPLQARSAPIFALIDSNSAAESGEGAKRRDTRKEEIGAALYGPESWKALLLLRWIGLFFGIVMS